MITTLRLWVQFRGNALTDYYYYYYVLNVYAQCIDCKKDEMSPLPSTVVKLSQNVTELAVDILCQ